MIRPVDFKDDSLWNLVIACSNGDLNAVQALISQQPELVHREYDYTPALHFAVRAGHLEITRFLLDHGADPTYQTHPFFDSLVTMAKDREYSELAAYLRDVA